MVHLTKNKIILQTILISCLSGFLSWFFLGKIIPFLNLNFLDNPNQRSSHIDPVPSGGGIIFVLISCIICAFMGYWLPIYCLPLSIVGFIDDRKSVNALIRYIFQIFSVLIILINSNVFDLIYSSLDQYAFLIIFVILLVIGTAIINFINFMDGLDGFIALNLILILLFSAILVNSKNLYIASSLIGFIYWNWQPAKVFMGDVGSTFLGTILFGIIVNSNSINQSLDFLFISFPLLGDAFICVIRRFFAGHNIFKPHKLHLYQRLNQAGLSHSNVTKIYAILIFVLGLFILFDINYIFPLMSFYLILGYFIEIRFALPFDYKIIK